MSTTPQAASVIEANAGLQAVGTPDVPAGATVLTVGVGEEFSTIGAAVAAAQDGDVILVDAGTYTNDFATITAKVTLIGVGGMVNMVATEPPPNLKGILTVDNDATIENFSFSGCAIDDADGGNGAGIRYEGGQMTLENDAFSDNQDGILGSPVIPQLTVNTISIDHCVFSDNGSGTGYTHNAYIGNVTTLTATNSVFEGAVVGHELKSRAYNNVIEGNVIQDGPTGTASYDIDLPNGGDDLVEDNVIEKGPDAENDAMVHFGGEGIPYAGSSLTVEGNDFIDDLGPQAVGVLNQTAITVTITGNSFANLPAGSIVQGPATETSNYDGSGNLLADGTQTGVLPGSTLIITDAQSHTVTLGGSLSAVEGGAGLLTVIDPVGHVIVIGGSGGVDFTEQNGAGGSQITTQAGSVNMIAVVGQDLIDSQGTDTIVCGAGNVTGQINGNTTITDGTGNDQWAVLGTATITGQGSNPIVSVGAQGNATITGPLGYLQVQNNGGTANINVTEGGATEALSMIGGAATVTVYGGAMSITTAAGPQGATLRMGAGVAQIVSEGSDVIYAGSGAETIIVTANATIYAGTGTLSVFGRGDMQGAAIYGKGGHYTLNGDTGNLTYYGGAVASTVTVDLANNTLVGGAALLTVDGGSCERITGGSGGLFYNAIDGGGANTITTAAGATDRMILAGADLVTSYGNDTINAGAGNQIIAAYGTTSILGSTGASRIELYGTETLQGRGTDFVTVHQGATVSLVAGGFLAMSEQGATANVISQVGPAGQAAIQRALLTGGSATATVGSDRSIAIATAAGTTTAVHLVGGTATVASNGSDAIYAASGNDTITVSAQNTQIWGGTGNLAVNDTDCLNGDPIAVYGGSGSLAYQQGGSSLKFIGGSGAATINGGWGALDVTGGSGQMTISGGGAGLDFVGGSGSASIAVTANGGLIRFGSGQTTVQELGWGHAVLFEFLAGHGGGTDVINNFQVGTDQLNLQGVRVASMSVAGGSTTLALSDHTHVQLVGVTNTAHLFG